VSSLVFVSVGTDHHPFDRLVRWVDAWLPEGVKCVVQYGTSAPPRRAEGHAYLDHGALNSLLDEAAVVICHGGPTTITESRRHGRRPIVVPRSPALGEHVDDHQQRFCARMEAKGLITVAAEEDAFRSLLGHALAAPDDFAVPAYGGDVEQSVARFGDLVADLLARRG
jgi:UDP-N-acetylglucosamine transferase subunit ALG13